MFFVDSVTEIPNLLVPRPEPLAHSEPKKSNPASQGNGDVQKMRTLRAPDLSKVHLGAGGEKLKILASMFVLEIDFFDHGNF